MVRLGACGAVLGAAAMLLWGGTLMVASAVGAQLPDARAYEMVSPPAKNGIEVIPQTDKTHVAVDGNVVTFSALGGFGALEGSTFDFEYISRRAKTPSTNGWVTHGINPGGRPETVLAANNNNTTYVNAFAADLDAAVYKSWSPLTVAPNVAEASNLYRVTGLNGGRATVELLSDGVTPVPSSWPLLAKVAIQPAIVGASADLAHVVFESRLALTTDAPTPQGFVCVVFGFGCPLSIYENADGAVRLVARIPTAPETSCDDVKGPACISAPSSQAGISGTNRLNSRRMVSDDGRRILFQVPGDADSGAIYLREDGVRTAEVAENGQLWDASADASKAFFITSDSLLSEDSDSNPDLYMYDSDASTGSRLTLVSASSVNDGYVETVVGASSDGRYVYFVCDGQLVAGAPTAGIAGLYVWHDGSLAYIGKFPDVGQAAINGPRASWGFVDTAMTSRVTPDGRHLLFMTQSDAGFRGRGGFAGYEHAGHRELYLYSADSGRLVCVSCNPKGAPATTDALIDVREAAATSASTSDSGHVLSDDGRRVFFSTREALVAEDTNARADAYEYDATSGSVHLLSSGKDPSASYFIDASDNGDDAFFVTRERLLGWDVDSSYDFYDARVNGGFAEPTPPTSGCVGEACLGQGSTTPAAASGGSADARSVGPKANRGRRHRICARRSALRHVRGQRRCVHRRHRSHHGRAKRVGVQDERSAR